jgi:Na+-translocating membrane potential-generating system (MpsC)
MKGTPAQPGGQSTSKPVWPNTSGCSVTPVFFSGGAAGRDRQGWTRWSNPARRWPNRLRRRPPRSRSGSGRSPRLLAVVLSGETLVVTLLGALSPAVRALARTAEGAAEMQEYHRRLFTACFDEPRQQIKRITASGARQKTAPKGGPSGLGPTALRPAPRGRTRHCESGQPDTERATHELSEQPSCTKEVQPCRRFGSWKRVA